ncbi:O-antigen ligase family protein [Bowdeniella nasicola]|nr:O-antigen ligase family protein [Bowdeniella nasicola]
MSRHDERSERGTLMDSQGKGRFRAALPPTDERENPLLSNRSPSLLQVCLGFLLVMQGVPIPAGGGSVPLSELAALAFLTLALFRRPERQLSRFGVVGVLAVALILYLIGVTIINDGDWLRRAFRIAMLMGLIGVFASGRVDMRAALRGAVTALAINIPLFYLGLVPDTYGGVLTGFIGDKNVAGLYYAVVPLLLAATSSNNRYKVALLIFGATGTVLTDSRTSMAALACAIIWVVASPKLGMFFRMVLFGGFVVAIQYIEENFARALVYAERVGSDRLRAQIDRQSWEKVGDTPWYGSGLNQAFVIIEDRQWWFHNSYWGLWVEGGAIFCVVVVLAYIILGLRPFSAVFRSRSRIAVEGAAIVLLVCASRLGETFITVPGALLLACGLMLTAEEMRLRDQRAYQLKVERVQELNPGMRL